VGYALLMMFVFASLANAVELRHVVVRTGTDGLDSVPLRISNQAGEELSCNADFAHWYSAGVATIAPAQSTAIPLWYDPQSGTYSILNDKRENLPVERLWCGLSGRAYATRAQITIDRSGASKGALAVSCSMTTDHLACR
jgi:hypothetical protein